MTLLLAQIGGKTEFYYFGRTLNCATYLYNSSQFFLTEFYSHELFALLFLLILYLSITRTL